MRWIAFCLGGMLVWISGVVHASPEKHPTSDKTPWAVVSTTQGFFVIALFDQWVPKTVAHFVGLATGSQPWRDPKTRETVRRPFYDGLSFFRVIPTYFLQTGCPLHNGKGGPGYTVADEFHPQLKHRGAGVVGMSSAGPNTNGSQFYITLRATPWLDAQTLEQQVCANFEQPVRCQNHDDCVRYAKLFPQAADGAALCKKQSTQQGHTIFGQVVAGMDVLNKITEQPMDANGRPFQPIRILRVEIRYGKRWNRNWLRTQPKSRRKSRN